MTAMLITQHAFFCQRRNSFLHYRKPFAVVSNRQSTTASNRANVSSQNEKEVNNDRLMLELAKQFGLETGKPTGLTADGWKRCFETMKLFNYETPLRKCLPEYLPELEFGGYSEFLNGVLLNIREGETDYCTRVYHIADLLKLVGNRLQAEYLPEEKMFQVWLEVD